MQTIGKKLGIGRKQQEASIAHFTDVTAKRVVGAILTVLLLLGYWT